MLLGIDVGTGGDAGGADRPHRQSAGLLRQRPCTDYIPSTSGGAEQDPEDWWRAAREAIAGAMAATELTGAEIEAVGPDRPDARLRNARRDGKVLRPALIWCDQRTQPQCDWLTEKIGFERADRAYVQPSAAQLYADQTAVGSRSPARDFRQNRARPVP